MRKTANKILPDYLCKPYKQSNVVKKGLIVSLTSFPARIEDVEIVIRCLKRQTILPEKILLWLSRKQFVTDDSIPQELIDLQDEIFEIILVEDDFRSHKKYYYACKNYPDNTIITCDDDQFYDPKMIERLLNNSASHPGCIIANKTSHIQHNNDGTLKSYIDWIENTDPSLTKNLLQIGLGGVLYPPHCMHDLLLREDLFFRLAPFADDIWLNTMARLKKTKIIQSDPVFLTLPISRHTESLADLNVGENMNDKQIRNIREYLYENSFPDVYSNMYV